MPLKSQRARYFISAGEPSGDLLGADLALALNHSFARATPFGVAGPAMIKAGVKPVATTADLGVMGIAEVARKAADLRMIESSLLDRIEKAEPEFAVLIDYPGFHFRLAEQLKMRGIRVYQYVAPKLWAWGEGRVTKLRRYFDLVLGILPFEESFFKERGVPYKYVGCPLKDRTDKIMVDKPALGLEPGQPVVACLPGSREAEVRRILPKLFQAKKLIEEKVPGTVFLVPVAPGMSIKRILRSLPGHAHGTPALAADDGRGPFDCEGFRFLSGQSLEAMAAADAAIVASGTATLECALLGTPMAVVYSMHGLTYSLARHMVRLPNVSLANLVAGESLVREFIQNISAPELAGEVISLLEDSERRRHMIRRFEEIKDGLRGGAAECAAETILADLEKPRPAFSSFALTSKS